jgi:hypothetical protein
MVLTLGSARAERDWSWNWNDRFAYDREGDHFTANEFTVDLFASYLRGHAHGDEDSFFDEPEHGDWGGGIGANYFFTRYIGIGADTTIHANGGSFVDTASGSLIVRVPIEAISLAPYVFGGGGYDFQGDDQAFGQVGAGLEFRLNRHTGVFVFGRYSWGVDSDLSLIRSGLRFAF